MENPNLSILIPDISKAEQIDQGLKEMWLSRGFQAICIVPLGQAGQWQGLLTLSWDKPHEFSNQEKAIFEALISLMTPAVQSRRLYKQAQIRAQREQALSQITAAVRGTTDPSSILQTAVREIGSALGRKAVIRVGIQEVTPDTSDNGNNDKRPA